MPTTTTELSSRALGSSPRIALALALTLLPLGCGETTVTSIGMADWCIRVALALRDRAIDCECPGEAPDDAELEARCAALPARSLDDAVEDDEVGWNGVLAQALVDRMSACDGEPVADDPVIGSVELGAPCRVFEDVATLPDDCVLGATCARPLDGGASRCIAIVGEGETCDEQHECAPGLVCGGGACVASTASTCGAF